MAKQKGPITNGAVVWGGALVIYIFAGCTFLAVVLAIADVFGPAVR